MLRYNWRYPECQKLAILALVQKESYSSSGGTSKNILVSLQER